MHGGGHHRGGLAYSGPSHKGPLKSVRELAAFGLPRERSKKKEGGTGAAAAGAEIDLRPLLACQSAGDSLDRCKA